MGPLLRRAVALLMCLMLVVAISGSSSAHSPRDYYPSRWGGDLSITWGFTPSFPTGSWRSRVRDGATEWNDVDQPMRWVQRSQYGSDFSPFTCPSTAEKNGIHWRDIDALGVTVTCYELSGDIYSTNIAFDSNGPDWYTGTGDAGDGFANACLFGCETDAWSISSHEFGHATGFNGPFASGHFDPTWEGCDTDSSQHTMCPFYREGTERWRTPNTHDEHTFARAY